ncbi:MAG: hypothetical protein EOO38_00170 [Cytophagaceae bacterium]|nr:MAG: hypothetical protein EOO38_00170 [Cytophagaceae bacterium]
MAVIKINHRMLKTRKFHALTRALGGREDTALGVLTHLWLRAVEVGSPRFCPSKKNDYIMCPVADVPAVYDALRATSYIEEHAGLACVPDVEAWLEGAGRRRERAVKANKRSAQVRKKKVTVKRRAQPQAIAVVTEPKVLAPVADDTDELLLATRSAWTAYSKSYQREFGAVPVRNAKVNALIKQFCKRLPLADAPQVLGFFVGHGNSYYAQRMYPLDLAVKDAESLHTQWLTGRTVTRASMERFEQNEKARAALERGISF